MCNSEIGTTKPLSGCWAAGGGVVVDAEDLELGASLEFSRRIPFGAHAMDLNVLRLNNHWTFDAGLGVQGLGWSGWRPQALAASLRASLAYNLANFAEFGAHLRGGYADVTNGVEEASGLVWAAGIRGVVTIHPTSLILEMGALSVPALPGDSRTGPYAILSGSYNF